MPEERGKRIALVAAFIVIVFGVGLTQTAVELRHGTRPHALELFSQMPTETNLRAFEKDLEDACLFSQTLRPWMQYAQFVVLNNAGDKAINGRDGWLFYKPGVQYLTETPLDGASDACSAIIAFRDQALRGRIVATHSLTHREIVPLLDQPHRIFASTPPCRSP